MDYNWIIPFNNLFDMVYILTIPKNFDDIGLIVESNKLDNIIILNSLPVEEFVNILDANDVGEGHGVVVSNSHKRICKHALDNGYNKIMIFEDDAEKNKSDQENIDFICDWLRNNEWDIFYFGHYLNWFSLPINKLIVRTRGAMCVHAFAINKKIMERIVHYYRPSNDPINILELTNNDIRPHGEIDTFLRKECNTFKAYAAIPSLYYQKRFSKGLKIMHENFFSNETEETLPNLTNNLVLAASILILIFASVISLILLFYTIKYIFD